MEEWNAAEAMIKENNHALTRLRKYEETHRDDLPAGAIYWAVVHEIEHLERQNRELSR